MTAILFACLMCLAYVLAWFLTFALAWTLSAFTLAMVRAIRAALTH